MPERLNYTSQPRTVAACAAAKQRQPAKLWRENIRNQTRIAIGPAMQYVGALEFNPLGHGCHRCSESNDAAFQLQGLDIVVSEHLQAAFVVRPSFPDLDP